MNAMVRRVVVSATIGMLVTGLVGGVASATVEDDPRGAKPSAENLRLNEALEASAIAQQKFLRSGLAADRAEWQRHQKSVAAIFGADYAGTAPADGQFAKMDSGALAAPVADGVTAAASVLPASKLLTAKRSTTTGTFPSVGQMNDYYCGPAAAYNVLAHLGYSGTNGQGLYGQGALGTSTYLNTNAEKKTAWEGETMPKGVNKWMANYGKPAGVRDYVQYYFSGTLATAVSGTKTRVVQDIAVQSQALFIEAAERKGSQYPKYNKHPEPKSGNWRGHWLTIYGYADNGGKLYLADPIHGVYTGPSPRFSVDTQTFIDRHVHDAAGDSGYDYGLVW